MSAAAPGTATRKLPPVDLVAVVSMVLVIVSTIYMAARISQGVTIAIPAALVAAGGAVILAGLGIVGSLGDFPKRTFQRVALWVLVGYGSIAGMLEYVFVRDGMRGERLVVMSLGLLVFALDVTVLLGFSVARYQRD